MIKRELVTKIIDLAAGYPVVAITGPRQSGKTTLAIKVFADKPYVNLEALDVRNLAITDPRSFLARYPNGAILDEIQKAPQLLSYIQEIVDAQDAKGLFILTGSSQLLMHKAITQSLAGRVALTTLLPLSINELKNSNVNCKPAEYLLNGFFPRIYKNHLNPTEFYRNYFQTYIERDVRELINVKNLALFEKFIKLLAGRIGQVLNVSSLCNDVGISTTTAKEWLSILEASYLIFRLQPYFENFGKRLIKAPKLYFLDPGLAAYLLEIENISQIERDPLRGNLFENMVILELIKARYNQGQDHNFYFYRDNNGNEVDVIFKTGYQLIPIEIKSSATFTTEFLKNIKYFKSLSMDRCSTGAVIYSGTQEQRIDTYQIINYINAVRALDALEVRRNA